MINDIRFAKREEKSLDEWVNDTISQVDEIIYTLMLEINLVLYEVARYAR